jgi:two-component system, NtrC family, sensor kinase
LVEHRQEAGKNQSALQILWLVGPAVQRRVERALAASPLLNSSKFCDNPVTFFENFAHQLPAVVVVDDNLDVLDSFEILHTVKREWPRCSRVWLADRPSADRVELAINDLKMTKTISLNDGADACIRHLEQAILIHQRVADNQTLMKEVTQHNRELEKLSTSLEKIVNERTVHIEKSNEEEKEKLNRVRKIVSFLKNVSEAPSIEDVISVLKKEIKSFHRVGEPLLLVQERAEHQILHSFRGSQFGSHKCTEALELIEELQIHRAEVSSELANQLSRPVGRVISLPLELKLMKTYYNPHAKANLYLENALNEEEIPRFLEFILDRVQALSVALDRIFLQEQMEEFSFRWEKTFDGIKDPIAIIDADFKVIRSNKAFSTIKNSRPCHVQIANSERPCAGCPILSQKNFEMPKKSTVQIQDQTYEVHAFPLTFLGGDSHRTFVNHYVNVTESRKLYLRVIQSEKMGAIGQLAGNIAHELNNPLSGIKSLAQVLKTETSESTQLYSDLVEIEKATERSQSIIKNLLEFSRTEGGPLQRVKVDEVIQKTLPMLKTALRNHKYSIDYSSEGAEVLVEPQLLSQVIFNLVNNSCQAMEQSGLVKIQTMLGDGFVLITVSDSGPGIPEGMRDKIFEPFYTTKKEGSGTGLGLSLAKSVIERFGGRIWLDSEIKVGTVFSIQLPVAKGEI